MCAHIFGRCLGIVLTPDSNAWTSSVGRVLQGGAPTSTGGGGSTPAQTGHITFIECDGERNAGFGREGQRTTNQLRLGSSTLGISNYTCAPAYIGATDY